MFWRILRQNPSTALGCSELQEPPLPPKKTNTFWCAKSRMRGDETPGRIVTNFCTCRRRGPRRNHVCRFVLRSLTGFGRGGGENFGFLHWLASSPLQHFRTTVRVCDNCKTSESSRHKRTVCSYNYAQDRRPLFNGNTFVTDCMPVSKVSKLTQNC